MASVWNDTIGNRTEKPPKERGYLWATDLGKSPLEIFLKMRGVQASNPPNQRAYRKFGAGNLMEWVVSIILMRAGVLKDSQGWLNHQYPGLLEVTGRMDFMAGGIPDYSQFEARLKEISLPDDIMAGAEGVMNHFRTKYPEGLADKYLEIKSCSSFAMNAMERTKRSSRNHRLQLFHYLKAANYPMGLVVYICRDDLRMFEVPVKNPSDVEDEYKTEIERLSSYYQTHKTTPLSDFLIKPDTKDILQWEYNPAGIQGLPPLDKNIVWDVDWGKFTRNWNVEYSAYLTMLYGYQTQLEFEEAVNPTVSRWNRVIGKLYKAEERKKWLEDRNLDETNVQEEKVEGKRIKNHFIEIDGVKMYLPDNIKTGYEILPKNQEVLEEIKNAGYDPMELVKEFAGESEEEEAN